VTTTPLAAADGALAGAGLAGGGAGEGRVVANGSGGDAGFGATAPDAMEVVILGAVAGGTTGVKGFGATGVGIGAAGGATVWARSALEGQARQSPA